MPVEDAAKIKQILEEARTIAVVGASPKPWRDSGVIVQFLVEMGYTWAHGPSGCSLGSFIRKLRLALRKAGSR
jgi:hypothetical protein